MESQQLERWEQLFEQKRNDLLEEQCETAVEVQSLEDLQRNLHQMAVDYHHGLFPVTLHRLKPSLNHLQSFTRAISSAAQYNPVACLVWGAIQALMESANTSSSTVDEVVDLVVELNNTLPQFESYLNMFPQCHQLQFHLQDLYDDYMDYCIQTVQYMKRSSTVNFLRYFLTSSPQQALRKTKTNVLHHIKLFRRAARLAHEEKLHKQHAEIYQTLATKPLTDTDAVLTSHGKSTVAFPISTVSMFRNYTFIGREDILKGLHDIFSVPQPQHNGENDDHNQSSKHGSGPACCVLHGLGGIGKTQTALEFTYLFRGEYDAIFWVVSEQDSSLISSFAMAADKLGLTSDLNVRDGQNQKRAVERVIAWLKDTTRKWLLVFDNVEDMNDLNPYLPTDSKTQGSILITTQKPDFFPVTDIFQIVNVKSFSREDGSNLLFRYLRRDPIDEEEKESAEKISDLLDGLPLALATIGGYINQTVSNASDFLENLKTSSKAWEASAIGPAKQYEKTLKTVFEIAFQELPDNARSLLNILAFLDPDSIPEDLFVDNIGSPFLKFLDTKSDYIEIIRTLRCRQLIRRDTSGVSPYISIHRTVQWNVLLDLSRDYEHRWQVFSQALDLIRNGMPLVSPIDNPEPEKWADFEKYVPQVLNLRIHCLWPEPPVELPSDFAQVMSDLATYMWQAGLFSEGTDALYTAEHILDDQHIGDDNPLRGNIHEHIGIFASFNGVSEREECMVRRHKARKARQASHSQIPKGRITLDDEIRLFNVESDMAFGLMQQEDFVEAQQIIEECHGQYQKWGSKDDIPFEYLKYNHIMSYVHMSQKDPIAAIQSCTLAAQLSENCAGPMHPTTQIVKFSLANHLYLAGEVAKSLEMSKAVLHVRSKMMSEFNFFTLESHVMCAALLLELDRCDEAEQHLSRCLERRKRSVWNEEGVARAQFFQGKVLQKLGHAEESHKSFIAARQVRDRFVKNYPRYLSLDSQDELAVFDQMVSIWAGRFTGKLKQPSPSL